MICLQKKRILIKHYQLIITLEPTLFECKIDQQIISIKGKNIEIHYYSQDDCLLYTSPSPRDRTRSRMPSSA